MKSALLEFFGSFAITFFGAYSRINNSDNLLAVGLTYFLIVSSLSYAFIALSGAQFNPIMTLSLILTKQIDVLKAGIYVCFQLLGSLMGGLFVYTLYKSPYSMVNAFYGEPLLHENQKVIAVSLDMLSMILLVFVYSTLADQSKFKHVFGVAHGAVYLVNMLAFGHLSGGCINIVELIGPSLFSQKMKYWGYYISAQLIGAIASALICKVFLRKQRAFVLYEANSGRGKDKIE